MRAMNEVASTPRSFSRSTASGSCWAHGESHVPWPIDPNPAQLSPTRMR